MLAMELILVPVIGLSISRKGQDLPGQRALSHPVFEHRSGLCAHQQNLARLYFGPHSLVTFVLHARLDSQVKGAF